MESRSARLKLAQVELVPINTNLVDEVWSDDAEHPKPPLPQEKVWVLTDEYTG